MATIELETAEDMAAIATADTIKLHSPQANGGGGEQQPPRYERFTFGGDDAIPLATIYLSHDGANHHYIAFYLIGDLPVNVEASSCDSRRLAIEDGLRGATSHAAKSRKKADKAAAKILHEILERVTAANDATFESELCGEEFDGAAMFGDGKPTAPASVEATADAVTADACKCAADSTSTTTADNPMAAPACGEVGGIVAEPAITGVPAADILLPPTKKNKKTAAPTPTPEAIEHFRERMARAEKHLSAAVLHRVECDARLKSAKASEKECIQTLQGIAARGPEILPLFDGGKKDAPLAPSAAITTTPPAPASEAKPEAAKPDAVKVAPPVDDLFGEPPTSTDWRLPTIDVLGLPPKLADRLREEGCATIGALEDKRAALGGLSAIKGIGPAKVTLIEDAIVKWLTANRDARTFGAVKEGAGK